MLIKLLLIFSVASYVFAAPTGDEVPLEKQQPTVIPIVSQSEELEPNGTYKFSYETGNGIKREETQYDKVIPRSKSRSSSEEGGEDSSDSDEIHVQRGSYSYTAPDGTLIKISYIADENGFQPFAVHYPKGQPLPAGVSSGEKAGRALSAADNIKGGSASPAAITLSAKISQPSPPVKSDPSPISAAVPDSTTPVVTTAAKVNSELSPTITESNSTDATTELAKSSELSSTPPQSGTVRSSDSTTAQNEPMTPGDIASTAAQNESTSPSESTKASEPESTTAPGDLTTPSQSSTTTVQDESTTPSEVATSTSLSEASISSEQASTTTQSESTTTSELVSTPDTTESTSEQISTVAQNEATTSNDLASTSIPEATTVSEPESTSSESPSTKKSVESTNHFQMVQQL